jgi:hypothetical protein
MIRRDRVRACLTLAAALLACPWLAFAVETTPDGPQGGPGSVTLPLDEFDRLTERAAHPRVLPEAPPAGATLSEAVITARVTGENVRGTIELLGEVHQKSPVKVPLVSGATLVDARMGAKALPLADDGSSLVAVLSGPGPFAVTVEFAAAIAQEPGRASFTLPTPLARSTRLALEIPRDRADVRLEGGLVTRRTFLDGATSLEAALDGGRAARVSWTVREAPATQAQRQARWISEVRTLASVGEADLRLTVLLDVSVVAGQAAAFEIDMPDGYTLASTTGASLDSTTTQGGVLTLQVGDASRTRHQFLVALERTTDGGTLKTEVPLLAVRGSQRETGEVAVEGIGTMELTTQEEGTLKRMDVREAHPALGALARQPLLAAFRYFRRPSEPPRLTVEAQRFPAASVLAATAEHATVTTMLTDEGRSLTEVTLTVRNHAQPYLRVALPEGASLLSAEIAGESVKPVEGTDGTRLPLFRPGFRPSGPYVVSFVYMHAGTALGKRGQAQLALPRMDVPVNLVRWEVFVPDRYRIKDFGGTAAPDLEAGRGRTRESVAFGATGPALVAGQLGGVVYDATGAVVRAVKVKAINEGTRQERTTETNASGHYVLVGLAPGSYTVEYEMPGFRRGLLTGVPVTTAYGARFDHVLEVAGITETITVKATGSQRIVQPSRNEYQMATSNAGVMSQNVVNLQRRIAGVLPVKVDVPRAGSSYRFVRPLVLDEETTVTFKYKAR